MWWRRLPLRIGAMLLAVSAAGTQADAATHVALIEIDGAIGPATAGYFDKASRQAAADGAGAIVLRIDTPGGLDSATRDIVRGIVNSPIPVIGYVAPGGARAASAGTFILYACHVAAMAPTTHLGSATPVPVFGTWPRDKPSGPAPDDLATPSGENESPAATVDRNDDSGDPMRDKVLGEAVAWIRSLAERHGRNADWAERAVRDGVSISSREALELKVVDLVSPDTSDLLARLDGRVVTLTDGERRLTTAGMTLRSHAPDWRMRFLAVLTNPTIAYLLMLAGIYGLLLEGYSPGAVFPGVLGAICLLLGLFAFQLLPVNYVGVALILLGIALIVGESLVPSFGMLGFGGIAAFVFGSILLLDIDVPGYESNLGIVAGVAVAAITAMVATVFLLMRSRRSVVATGEAALLRSMPVVSEFSDGHGWAKLQGEHWRIRSDEPLTAGERVRVLGVEGLTLRVRRH